MSNQFAEYQLCVEAIKKQKFVILDTETTGLNEGEICEIAIIDAYGETLLNSLIRPKSAIPQDATNVHGITNDMVEHAPIFPEILPAILAKIRTRHVIVYNAVYDRRMFHQSAAAWKMNKKLFKDQYPWYCAMNAFAYAYGDYNSYRGTYRWQPLHKAAQFVGSARKETHRALADCLMTLDVCRWLADGKVRYENV